MFGRRKMGRTINIHKNKEEPVIVDFGDMKMMYKFGNAQHIGKRKIQEDCFGFSNITNSERISQKGICAVLSDGMGGLSNGRYVSEYVVGSTLSLFDNLDYSINVHSQLEAIVCKINDQVCKSCSGGDESLAGATIAAVAVYKDKLFWVCVGDSRIYLLRRGYLYQLNEDHVYRNKLIKDYLGGHIKLNAAFNDEQKNSLTSYIGNPKMPFVDCNRVSFSLQKGDKVMLCSDGVYNSLSDYEMIKRLQEEPQHASEGIVHDILNKKVLMQDNLTVMIINFT